jgi:transposase
MILEAAQGANNSYLAEKYDLSRGRVRDWRQRWTENQGRLEMAAEEGVKEEKIAAMIWEILEDQPRSGKPPTYTLEQVVQIISVGCEDPSQSGRATSHWSHSELAAEVNKRGITSNISPRSVGRFLKRSQSTTSSL